MFGGDAGLGNENAKGLFDSSGAWRVNLTPSPGSTSQAETVVATNGDFFRGFRGAGIGILRSVQPSKFKWSYVTVALNGCFRRQPLLLAVPHWFGMTCNLNVLHSTNRAIALPGPAQGAEDHELRVDN